jgi:hypothetical protein
MSQDTNLPELLRITQYNKDNGIIDVSVLADSISDCGDRITSFLLHRFPKGQCQAELNKSRTVANNSFSSRAVNKQKFIVNILKDPYIPLWSVDRSGMVGDLVTDANEIKILNSRYLSKMYSDIGYIQEQYVGIHKQDTNSQLDSYARIPIIVTSTNWEYFFGLRCADGVKPEFRRIALIMEELFNNSSPKLNDWHIPWITPEEESMDLEEKLIMCAARSAWLSYSNHNKQSSVEDAKKLVDKLIQSKHYSVFDHAACNQPNRVGGIYKGWQEHRQLLLT